MKPIPPQYRPSKLVYSYEDRLWVFEQPFVLGVDDIKIRMSVIKINERDFLLYAPIGCTMDLLNLMEENISGFEKLMKSSNTSLTTSKKPHIENTSFKSKLFIVLPSIFPEHWLFVREWLEKFHSKSVDIHIISVVPEWIVKTTCLFPQNVFSKNDNHKKVASFTYLTSVALGDTLPSELQQNIDIVMFQSLILKECILYSKQTKTLHVSDSGFQISSKYAPTKFNQFLVKRLGLYNRFSTVPFFRIGITKDASNRLFNRVLTCSFDTIITAHTDGPLVGAGKEKWIEGMKLWMI